MAVFVLLPACFIMLLLAGPRSAAHVLFGIWLVSVVIRLRWIPFVEACRCAK